MRLAVHSNAIGALLAAGLSLGLLLVSTPDAQAQSGYELVEPLVDTAPYWEEYARLDAEFGVAVDVLDTIPAGSREGARRRIEAAELGASLIDAIETLRDNDPSISQSDAARLTDKLLDTRLMRGQLLVEAGECERGRTELEALQQDPLVEGRAIVRDRAWVWANRADECVQTNRTRATAAAAAEEANAAALTRAPERSGRSIVPGVVLLSVGGASLLGAIAYDATLADERSELSEIKDECREGPCERERGEELGDQIQGSRGAIGGLLAVGIAAGATGAVLTVRALRSRGADVAVSPRVGGASVRVSF